MTTLQALAEEYEGKETRSVYIMKFKFRKGAEYKVLYKIGVAKDPVERMLQVSRSFFMGRRYIPECELIRFRKSTRFFEIETELHKHFKDSNYKFKKPFDGSTELFDVDIDTLIEEYESRCPLIKKV